MGIGLFPYIYLLSLLRAQSHDRYFQVVIFGILISFISTAGETGVLGPNSSWGDQLDYNYLADTMISYYMGIGIGLFVNVCIFPDFGEWHVNEMLCEIYDKMAKLSRASTACLICSGFSQDEYLANCATRNQLVVEIQKTFGCLDRCLEQASREISYSHFSVKDYTVITQQTKSVAAVLFSEHTVLNGPDTVRLLKTALYQSNVTSDLRSAWQGFDDAVAGVFGGLMDDLGQTKREERGKLANENLVANLEEANAASLRVFSLIQPSVFTAVFENPEDGLLKFTTSEAKSAWEKFAQLNFHILAANEFVKEIACLYNETHTRAQEERRVRVHFGWIIQLKALFGRIKARWPQKYSAPTLMSTRKWMVKCKNFILSDDSVYAFKSAIAIMLFQLTLLISTNTYNTWYFERALAPIAVAMGPSIGQAYSTLIPRLVGTVAGGTLGYCGVLVFGKESPWHILIGGLQAIPVFYVNLFYPQHATLARLVLISYTMYLFISIAYLGDPTFPDPAEYLMKLVVVISTALVFVVLFQNFVYPMSARRILRSEMAKIFRNLNIFYRKIISSRGRTGDKDSKMTKQDVSDIKDFRNQIFSQLLSLETLVHYGTLEPRLERPFPEMDYRAVIFQQYELLDRLECLRLCTGEQPFGPRINRILTFGEYGTARAEMHSTIRVLLFIFASTMVTKDPLLPNLPKASHSRSKMIEGFVTMLLEHSQPHAFDGRDPFDGAIPSDRKGMLDALNTDKWVRVEGMSVSLREVSRVLDETVPLMKALFGEAADILDPEDVSGDAIVIRTTTG
ncbi:hypothetical protein HDU98_008653 [Podochytrium sp. JEL0797]|nr:hypothetical protein HDU98_008653 [Podochytrium sp. JEL0797]